MSPQLLAACRAYVRGAMSGVIAGDAPVWQDFYRPIDNPLKGFVGVYVVRS